MDGDDGELLRRWAQGEREAAEALFNRHFERVYGFMRAKVEPEVAEDLTQETFIACMEGLERLRSASSFRAYLFGVARKQLLRYWRKAGVREFQPMEHSVADIGPTPSGALAERREQQLLIAALRRIPLDFQITLELTYWEELRGREVAEILGIAEGTVRSRVTRARELLKQELERMENDPQLIDSAIFSLERAGSALTDRRPV